MAELRVRGVKIDYECYGDGEAPALLLVRGLGTQRIHWSAALLDGLVKRGFRVIAPDNRDVGHSQKFDGAAPYSLADMADDHCGLLDSLAAGGAHIMGISMGGMIVQQMAIRRPELVRSMTSIMSTSGAPGLPGPTEAAMAALLSQPDDPSDPESVVENTLATHRVVGSPGYPTPEADLREMARRAYERCYCPEGVARQMRAVTGDTDRADKLAGITAPTLVIHGENDPLVSIEGGRDTARRIPGARFQSIAGMGHDLPPGLTAQIVELVADHAQAADSARAS